MKYFTRSLKYVYPYKARIATSIGLVVLIACLWSGGIAMALPALKILLSEEGLHGWAWSSASSDKLGVKLTARTSSIDLQEKYNVPDIIVDIIDVKKDSPAAKADINKNWWIVGIEGADHKMKQIRGDLLLREIAQSHSDEVSLELLNTNNGDRRTATVTTQPITLSSRVLEYAAGLFPEPKEFPDRLPMLLWLLGIVIVITVLRDFLRFCQEYIVETTICKAIMDLRCENYNTALHLPVSYYTLNGTSDTMSRFINDTGSLSKGLVTLFSKTMVEPAKAVASIIAAFILMPKFMLIVCLAGPPVVIMIRLLGKRMKKASRRALESWAVMLAVLEETLVGIRVVKTYTMEAAERKRFYRTNRALFKQQRRMARIDAATAPLVEAFGITAGMVAAGLAGWAVLNSEIEPYVFMTWMGLLAAVFDPVRKLSQVATKFQNADAAAERVFELHDAQQEKRSPLLPTLPTHSKSIEFKNVSFVYPNSELKAVNNANFTIQAGQSVAIVGPNGCGKTTLLSMLPRLLDPTQGQILIDGHDIMDCSIRTLRQQIGVVTQETVIFNATIAENIAYGLRRPTREKVIEAAKKAFVDEFVAEMPEGYDTMVGQRGSTLSGGQRQRIAIARAILRDPAILIFDEALSQIDPDSEQKIYQATKEFIKGRTTFMIAHRFSTILASNIIFVMDGGKIIAMGSHEELLNKCELYTHLYRTQFSHDEQPAGN